MTTRCSISWDLSDDALEEDGDFEYETMNLGGGFVVFEGLRPAGRPVDARRARSVYPAHAIESIHNYGPTNG